jgi:hypothetical protein
VLVSRFASLSLVSCLLCLKSSIAFCLFAQPLLDRRRNHVEGITSGDEHLRRIRHRGNFDERVTQLRRVIGLRAVIGRPHVLSCALRRIVLDDLADPSDI